MYQIGLNRDIAEIQECRNNLWVYFAFVFFPMPVQREIRGALTMNKGYLLYL